MSETDRANEGMVGKALEKSMEVNGLTPEKLKVLELLASGKSVAAVAREAGLSRTTVYKWMNDDPAFMAAYNRWHEETLNSSKSRMLVLLEKAANAVEQSLDAGDGRLGLRMLEKMGVAKEHPVGPTTQTGLEEELLREWSNKREKAKMISPKDAMKFLFGGPAAMAGILEKGKGEKSGKV